MKKEEKLPGMDSFPLQIFLLVIFYWLIFLLARKVKSIRIGSPFCNCHC